MTTEQILNKLRNDGRIKNLAKLDMIEKQLWDAWERSCNTQQRQRVKKIRNKESFQEQERELTAMQGVGDPRYIGEIHRCITTRIKLLGLEPDSKLNLSFDQISDSQVDNLINKLISSDD